MYALWIGNQNYSSWSLRPWVLMRGLGIAFEERKLRFGDAPSWERYRRISPSGRVPCLIDGDRTVWDSLAIVEYLAEKHGSVWPQDSAARAWARSASAEMHSGFTELRNRCSMSCGIRARLREFPPALEHEIARIGVSWNDGLRRFGGPFLAGQTFTAVDAFYAPVAFRIQTYGLSLDSASMAYAERLLALPAMREWYAAGLAETWRHASHEEEIERMATITEDLRAK